MKNILIAAIITGAAGAGVVIYLASRYRAYFSGNERLPTV